MSLCSDAISDVSGFDMPGYLVGSKDDIAITLLAAARRTAREVHSGYDWGAIRKDYTVSVVAGTDSYALPADYARLVEGTVFDADGNEVQPLSSRGRIMLNRGLTSRLPRKGYELRGPTLLIAPVPAADEDLTLLYASKNWCKSGAGAEQSDWLSDTDVTDLPQLVLIAGVRFYFKTAKGIPADTDSQAYGAAMQACIADDAPIGVIRA